MNTGMYSYRQAAEALRPMKISARTIRYYTSDAVPARRRLRKVKLGHRTVGIRPADLEKWKEANAV